MSDLVALVLRLRPERGQQPSHPLGRASGRSLGRAAQAWFLAEVERHDPTLAEQLHQGANLRPYTLGLRWGPEPFLRVTSVAPALSAFLLDRWLPGLPGWLRLDEVSLEIAGVAMQANDHPWAGQARYADLVQGDQAREERRKRGITFEFATPTLFRSNDLDVPLPLPSLVFDGLFRKWNRFAPVPLDSDLKTWLENHVAVNRYTLKTHQVRFGGNPKDVMGGFVGHCRFVCVGARQSCTQVAQCRALAQFAFYVGIGRRTATGLGQCRVLGASAPWLE